jgi:hypothetical protein
MLGDAFQFHLVDGVKSNPDSCLAGIAASRQLGWLQ